MKKWTLAFFATILVTIACGGLSSSSGNRSTQQEEPSAQIAPTLAPAPISSNVELIGENVQEFDGEESYMKITRLDEIITPQGIKIKLIYTAAGRFGHFIWVDSFSQSHPIPGYAEMEISTKTGANKIRFAFGRHPQWGWFEVGNAIKAGDVINYQINNYDYEITATEISIYQDFGGLLGSIFNSYTEKLEVKLHVQRK